MIDTASDKVKGLQKYFICCKYTKASILVSFKSDFHISTQQGESDIEQLCKVLQCLGTPTEENWPVSNILAVL